ncbi:TonB-dependent siderophore receptor [Bowmanella denitrificans]|uniref:TonB-dependent siderophore receptor n=1 Tax=Bowmanella denitrificans TaxID=366582 RepID=UPI0031E3F406
MTLTLTAGEAEAWAESIYPFDLQQGSLSQCLNTIARTANIYISVDSQLIADKPCTGFSQRLSAQQALKKVLSESGLHYQQVGDVHFVVQGEAGVSQGQGGPTEIRVTFSLPDKQTTLFTPLSDWQDVTSSSSGIAQSVKQLPQTVSLVNPKTFLSFSQTDLGEVLRSSPGIYSTANAITGNREFRARGNLLNPFLIDGQPFAESNFAVSELDAGYFNLFEINRGTNGVQQDNGVNSASVNLLPKPASEEVFLDLSASYGELLNRRLSADIGGALLNSSKLMGRLVMVEQKQQDAADHSHNIRSGGYGRLTWHLSDALKLDFYHIEQQDQQRERSKIRPLLYADLTPYDGPLSTNFWPNWSGGEQHLGFSHFLLEHQLNSTWRARLSLSKAIQKSDMLFQEFNSFPDRQTLSMAYWAYQQQLHYKTYKGSISLDGEISLYSLPVDISLTASSTDSRSFQRLNEMDYQGMLVIQHHSFEALNRDEPLPDNVLASYINDLRVKVDSIKLASLISLTTSTRLSASVRRNHSRYLVDSSIFFGETEEDNSQYNNLYLGISQAIGEIQLYASYTDIVDFRSGYLSMLNIGLLPVRHISTELGIKADFWQRKGQLSLSAYQSRPQKFGLAPDITYNKQAGWEAEFRYQNQAIQINLAYARRHSVQSADNANVQFPDTLYRATVGYSLPWKALNMTFGAAIEGESRQHYLLRTFIDTNRVNVSQPASWRLNAYYKWQFGEGSALTLSIKNVLDKGYFDGVDLVRGWAAYGAPRQITLTIDQHF